jgi:hypothetical protein
MRTLAPTTFMATPAIAAAPPVPAVRPRRPSTQVLQGEFEQETA